MTKKKTGMDVFILLDRTGSMAPLWEEAVSSVNAYVKELAKDKAKDKITLAVFDAYGAYSSGTSYSMVFEVLRDSVPIKEWEDFNKEEASPRGMTPLFDATMKLISMAEEVDNKKTTIVVMTDGLENASSENTREAVKVAIDRITKKGWQVNFLGANFDGSVQAGALGVMMTNSINYAQGCAGQTMSGTARAHSTYRNSACGQSVGYSDEDRIISKENEVK